MGKITTIAIGVMIVFTLVGMMATAMYTASPDTSKTTFQMYKTDENFSQLGDENLTNDNDSVSNMDAVARAMVTKIIDSQRKLNEGTAVEAVLGAFGLISAVTIDVIFLLLAILLDGINFIGGILLNVDMLPTPWSEFGKLGILGLALFVVFTVFKIAEALTGRQI